MFACLLALIYCRGEISNEKWMNKINEKYERQRVQMMIIVIAIIVETTKQNSKRPLRTIAWLCVFLLLLNKYNYTATYCL